MISKYSLIFLFMFGCGGASNFYFEDNKSNNIPNGDGGASDIVSEQGNSNGEGGSLKECNSSNDCSTSVCSFSVCQDHVCVNSFLPSGTWVEDTDLGNCLSPMCNGSGEIEEIANQAEVGNENDCSYTVCEVVGLMMTAVHYYKEEGAPCITNTSQGHQAGICFWDDALGSVCRTNVPTVCELTDGRTFSCPPLAEEVYAISYHGRDNKEYVCLNQVPNANVWYCPTNHKCEVIFSSDGRRQEGICVN